MSDDIKELKKEIESLKNQLKELTRKTSDNTKVCANYVKTKKELVENMEEANLKISNQSDAIGNLRKDWNKQMQEGGVSGSNVSIDETTVKKMVEDNIDWNKIKVFMDKNMPTSIKDSNSKTKSSKKINFIYILIFIVICYAAYFSWNHYKEKLITVRTIPKGTIFKNITKNKKGILKKDKKVEGRVIKRITSEGTFELFVVDLKDKNGKINKYEFLIKKIGF